MPQAKGTNYTTESPTLDEFHGSEFVYYEVAMCDELPVEYVRFLKHLYHNFVQDISEAVSQLPVYLDDDAPSLYHRSMGPDPRLEQAKRPEFKMLSFCPI